MIEKLENISYAILEGFGSVMTAYVLAEIGAEWFADVDLNKEIDKTPARSWTINLSLLGISCFLSYKAYKRAIAAEERLANLERQPAEHNQEEERKQEEKRKREEEKLVNLERQLEECKREIAELKNGRSTRHVEFLQSHPSQPAHSETSLREVVVHDAARETTQETNVHEDEQTTVRIEKPWRRSAASSTFSNLRRPLLQEIRAGETERSETGEDDGFTTPPGFESP